ncbi:MAG: glycosyltransferase family 4 protein, partial [Roseovarius sp.]
FTYMDGYSVSSGLLDGIYRGIDMFPDPLAVLPDGVDQQRFRPERLERLGETERPLRVGWVGNSKWGIHTGGDPKGLTTILDPAIRALREEGCEIERHYADASVHRRSREEMVGYYGEIDVLVCSSEIEGTPNPVLEAMASGVPVVSTRVGIVPDALGPKQSAFILPGRSIAAMADALRRLVQDRALLAALSEENLTRVKAWSWEETTKGWPAFWEAATRRQQEGIRIPLKRHMLRERYAGWYAENVKMKGAMRPASGAARVRGMKSALHGAAVDWIYRTPERAAWVNRLRGRR